MSPELQERVLNGIYKAGSSCKNQFGGIGSISPLSRPWTHLELTKTSSALNRSRGFAVSGGADKGR